MQNENIVVSNTPKKVMASPYSMKSRIQRDEEELAELLQQEQARQKSQAPEQTEETQQEETQAQEETVAVEEKKKEEPVGWEKRYKDLQRFTSGLQTKIKELETLVKAPEQTKTALPDFRSEEEVKAWMAKYPEAAAMFRTIASKEMNAPLEDVKKDIARLEKMRTENLIQKTEAAIIRVHPDYNKIKEDDEFHRWANDLPAAMQNILYETIDDPVGVSKIITSYKAEKGFYDKEEHDDQKAAASGVRTKSGRSESTTAGQKKFSESMVERMSSAEYAKNEEAINEAIRTGNFIFDRKNRK